MCVLGQLLTILPRAPFSDITARVQRLHLSEESWGWWQQGGGQSLLRRLERVRGCGAYCTQFQFHRMTGFWSCLLVMTKRQEDSLKCAFKTASSITELPELKEPRLKSMV